jgi:hypothetical protein
MQRKKRRLSLVRETIRELDAPDLAGLHGAIDATSITCGPAPTQRNSCFNSSYKTDCCLLVP